MINITEILIGTALALFLSIVLGLLFGSFGSYLGFLIAAMILSFLARLKLESGAIYGAISTIVAGIIFLLSMLLMAISLKMGPGNSMMDMGILGMIIGIMVDGLIGAVGGAAGAVLGKSRIYRPL